MSNVRIPREKRLEAHARLGREVCVPLEHLAGTVRVEVAGLPAVLSLATLKRWATEGKPGAAGVRVWLDVIVRGECWLSSREAVGRFLAELAGAGQPGRSLAG